MLHSIILAAACCACPPPADPALEMARPAPPAGVSGTIETVGADEVRLKRSDGTIAAVPMTSGWTTSIAAPAKIDALRVGQFIASANTNLAPGRGRATELRVFEPGYLPEFGTHQIAAPNTAMTHGFVFAIRRQSETTELDVYYPGGCRVIEVPAGVKVVNFALLERSAAAPGTAVSAVLRPDSDGIARSGRLVLAARSPNP